VIKLSFELNDFFDLIVIQVVNLTIICLSHSSSLYEISSFHLP